jgi:predicted dehydrogenase
MNVRWLPSFATLADQEKPDGVIVATPNQVHVANGLECIDAGTSAGRLCPNKRTKGSK